MQAPQYGQPQMQYAQQGYAPQQQQYPQGYAPQQMQYQQGYAPQQQQQQQQQGMDDPVELHINGQVQLVCLAWNLS